MFGYVTIYRNDLTQPAIDRYQAYYCGLCEALGRKYAPHGPEAALQAEIDRGWPALCVLEMTVLHLTGKQGRELAGRPAE